MTQFKKLLLAGTASLALIATPALAADIGASGAVGADVSTPAGGVSAGAKGGASGSGAAGLPSAGSTVQDATGTVQGTAGQAQGAAQGAASGILGTAQGAASGLGDGVDGSADGKASGGATLGDGANLDTAGDVLAQTEVAPAPPAQQMPTEGGAVNAIPEVDPVAQLQALGYSDIEPIEAEGDAATEGQAYFTATNIDGQRVNLLLDKHTGTVVGEEPAE